jgi:hypothetical protein
MTAPYKQIITVDLETYWDTKEGYTLSKMTTEEYIRDPRFKAFGACIHEFGSDKATQWHRGEELKKDSGSLRSCYYCCSGSQRSVRYIYIGMGI